MITPQHSLYSGVFTALMTPWLSDNTIDWPTLESYVTHSDHKGIAGWVVGGTTGEGMLLSAEESDQLIRRVKSLCPWATIIAGVTGLTLPTLVAKVNQAQTSGADAALVLTPYYLKPSQAALLDLYQSLHEHTSLPMIVYHNPGRTGVGLDVTSLLALSTLDRYVGIKDSTHDLGRPLALRSALGDRPWSLLCGEDDMFLPYTACGGSGIISVQSGILPRCYAQLWQAMTQGSLTSAQALAWSMVPVHKAMQHAANPVSVKTALASLGWGHERMRAPVGALSAQQAHTLHEALLHLSPVRPRIQTSGD